MLVAAKDKKARAVRYTQSSLSLCSNPMLPLWYGAVSAKLDGNFPLCGHATGGGGSGYFLVEDLVAASFFSS